jgi:hypothetical protein
MNLRIAAAPIVAFAVGFSMSPAAAGPCADQIAEFEQFLQEHLGAAGTAPQSVGAQLEHQPTPASIERARQNAKAEIAAALAERKRSMPKASRMNARMRSPRDGFRRSAGERGDRTRRAGARKRRAIFLRRANEGVNNFMTYLTGDIPVGAYDPNRLSNLGIGHGAIDAGGGYTYFDPQTGHEFSAVVGATYNLINPSTHYQNGIDAHLDWGHHNSRMNTFTSALPAIGRTRFNGGGR